MFHDLLNVDDYEDLPEEAGLRWVAIENLARSRLKGALDRSETKDDRSAVILQFIHIVSAAAQELAIQNVSIPSGTDPENRLNTFMISLQAATTKIMLTSPQSAATYSIKVSANAKERIRELVFEIEKCVPDLKLGKREEVRLRNSLQDFKSELEQQRSRFSIGSAHLVIALTVLNLAVTTTADAPDAVDALTKIQSIWGEEKERAESSKLGIEYQAPVGLLASPQKQIEGPKLAEVSKGK